VFNALSARQFTQMSDAITAYGVKLVICDFNGVLDDYYACKYDYLRDILGRSDAHHLATLAVFTDTEYMRDQSSSLEASIRKYFSLHKLIVDDATEKRIVIGMKQSRFTVDAQKFLEMIPVPLVVYTAQPQEIADQYGSIAPHVDWISAQKLGNPKPSVENLLEIMHRYAVTADEVCVIGDGLIDDLMPAKLLGMHALLVSPFADAVISRPTS